MPGYKKKKITSEEAVAAGGEAAKELAGKKAAVKNPTIDEMLEQMKKAAQAEEAAKLQSTAAKKD